MGNSQSNPADKTKIYKITGVNFQGDKKGSVFMLELVYKDENSKYIILFINGELDKNRHDYKVRDYLLVDLNMTSCRNSFNPFFIDDKVNYVF